VGKGVGSVAVGGPDVHNCCVGPIGAGPGYPVGPACGLKVASTRDACSGKVRLTLAEPLPIPTWDFSKTSLLLCSFTICAGSPWGRCGCAGKSDCPSSFAGAWRSGEPPYSSPSNQRRAGAGSHFFAKPGCSLPLTRSAPRDGMHPFGLHGRPASHAQTSHRECAAVYPLGC
jgi:hypothetical protein